QESGDPVRLRRIDLAGGGQDAAGDVALNAGLEVRDLRRQRTRIAERGRLGGRVVLGDVGRRAHGDVAEVRGNVAAERCARRGGGFVDRDGDADAAAARVLRQRRGGDIGRGAGRDLDRTGGGDGVVAHLRGGRGRVLRAHEHGVDRLVDRVHVR